METMKYVYGPVPSRRLGMSLGVSPIPNKTCNYSCVYCQLGNTNHMTNRRKKFFDVKDIINELNSVIKKDLRFDVVTIVGEGEPTLYLGLDKLVEEIKKITDKPVAIITNGSLLYDNTVQNELKMFDLVLPSMDAYDEDTYKKICRPYGTLKYDDSYWGLVDFSHKYKGQLWLEIMFMKGINDTPDAVEKYRQLIKNIRYDKLYLNTPVRPPAEKSIEIVSNDFMNYASEKLQGISIDLLESEGFHSEIEDDYQAILSIIKRHPMNQYEIERFLISRNCENTSDILNKLKNSNKINVIHYNGYHTFKLI